MQSPKTIEPRAWPGANPEYLYYVVKTNDLEKDDGLRAGMVLNWDHSNGWYVVEIDGETVAYFMESIVSRHWLFEGANSLDELYWLEQRYGQKGVAR